MLKVNVEKIKLVFILALVVLNSGYALSLGYQFMIMLLSMLFIAADIFISKKALKVSKNSLIFFVLMVSQFALSCVVNFDIIGIAEYIRLTGIFIFCYYVYISYPQKDIAHGFADLMYFIAAISIVFYVWITLFPSFAFRVHNGYGTEYLTCFFSFINTSSSGRNCGAFWEPSVFAAMCFLWGIVEICIIRDLGNRKLRIGILILTIITTYSTSGYLYLVFLFVLFIFRNDSKKLSLYRVICAFVLMTLCLVVCFNYEKILLELVEINPLVFKKLMTNNVSVTDRSIGPLADLYVAVRNPFGVGLTDLTSIVENIAYKVFGMSIHTRTSTITYYFAAFGWVSGIAIVTVLVNWARKNARSILLATIVISGLVFMSISTPLHASAVFIILLFMGTQGSFAERKIQENR